MNLLETILNANRGQNVKKLGARFDLDETQTRSAVQNLLPALSRGLQRNMASPGGLEGLLGALQKGGHQRYLDDPETLGRDEAVQEGNGILGHILGSKEVSRRAAGRASEKTGIDAGVLKKMLPLVATMVMGSMSAQAGRAGLKDAEPRAVPRQGALGALGSLLDSDDDGSVADDLFDMAKKFFWTFVKPIGISLAPDP